MIGGRENVLYDKVYAFALRIIKAYRFLTGEQKEYILSKQLLRCGTSIGANIAEANSAISNADFSAKMSIAYKESLETKYWLNLLHDSDYIPSKNFESILAEADELSKMLFTTIRSSRSLNNRAAIS
ncbi:four helix bundle protein [Hymenobacter arizonensis]|uniref:Four helix bundle protein n=1 Tax=Hymenobacter arizonensis TaxID=1227077 RepID=A0A1I5YZD8_HYMAR|nr:four helix bundle protein [Hymenobacter arizonensis]SFQ49561.1 four helix bundle protein [Hymenobacter arizonensis]